MIEDTVLKVEIREDGRLFVKPASRDFPYIYRAGMEVGWDPIEQSLFSPIPREWTYPMWFGQILAAASSEYGVSLLLTPTTVWINVPGELRSKIGDPRHWKGSAA